MSREIRTLIKRLEHERDSVAHFLDEIDTQVANKAISKELGEEIIKKEFEGHDPRDRLQTLNANLAEARSLITSAPSTRLDSVAPIAIIAVLAVAIVWNFGAITGLFTAGSETFYTIPIAQSITASQSIPLTINAPVTSLRVNGAITGAGQARIELVKDGTAYLVTSFDSSQSSTGLTGLVTDDSIATTNDTNTTNDTTNDTAVVLQPGASDAVPDVTVVNNPSAPSRSEPLDAACVETCSLPLLTTPMALRITTTDGVTVRIDDIVYGTGQAQLPSESPVNTTNETTPTEPAPTPVENTSNVNESPIVTPPDTTPVVTPPVETPATPATNATAEPGTSCTQDSDCASGVCIDDRYDGVISDKVCAVDRGAWCVANSTLYPTSTIVGDSACIAGTNADGTPDAAWLVSGGRGRFAIQSRESTIVAAIDKYGTMIVHGPASFNTTAGTDGWIVKDSQGTAQLSIDDSGSLLAAGTLATRTTPARTGEGDFVIRTVSGTDAAVITQQGTVSLTGDFLKGAQLP